MSFNFSALKTLNIDDDALLGISKPMAAFVVARGLGIPVAKALQLLDDNFPDMSTYRPGALGEMIRSYYVDEDSPWNSFSLGDPDEHNGE